jgi:predicted aldo/keto reductase-like oxidoreductase
MRVVEDSLRRLQTDHVDLVHVHSCDSEERLMDPNEHEAFDRLREQGKARFLGVSTHTPNLERVVDRALESQRFDVLMLAYHHGAWPRLRSLVERAAAADVGVVAMKTLKGAYHEGLLELTQQERRSYPQAAFRWVLADPAVSALVISFSKPQHLDEYLAASGEVPKQSDVALLAKYDRLIAGVHCMPHCGACLDSCPVGLPIDDILRFRMYFENYGDQKGAMRMYAELSRKADACVGCAAPCTSTCPVGIPIAERLRETHRILS